MQKIKKKLLILTSSIFALTLLSCSSVSTDSLDISSLAKTLQDNFYLDIDNRTLLDGMISGLTNAFGDDFTYYTSTAKGESQDYSTSGVGLGFSRTVYYGEALVRQVMKSSPAEKAGMKEGDIITKIREIGTDDNPFTGNLYVLKEHSYTEWTDAFKGESGEKVEVYYKRKNASGIYEEVTTPLTVTRGKYNSDKAVLNSITETDGKVEAYIKITSFLGSASAGETTPQEELKAIFDYSIFNNYDTIDHLIIDLRGNGGGYVDNCTAALGLFIPYGQATSYYEYKDGSTKALNNTTYKTQYTDKIDNISVIVDSNTASAGETFALGLRDYEGTKNKTHIFGQVSYGKGIAQAFISLFNDGSLIRYTFARVLSPAKVTINKRGIVPETFVGQQYIPYKQYTMWIEPVSDNSLLSEENTQILLDRINTLLDSSYEDLGSAIKEARNEYSLYCDESPKTSEVYDSYFANQFANQFYDDVITDLPASIYNAYIEGNDVDNDSFTPTQRKLVKEQINYLMSTNYSTFDKAVKAFQEAYNIESEDNIFTKETGDLLGGMIKDIYLQSYDYDVINEVRETYGK
jgi:carboxyl-terminal processing protease